MLFFPTRPAVRRLRLPWRPRLEAFEDRLLPSASVLSADLLVPAEERPLPVAATVQTVDLLAVAGQGFTTSVATLEAPEGEWQAAVMWGDGTRSAAEVVPTEEGGLLRVLAGHAYDQPGVYTFRLTLRDAADNEFVAEGRIFVVAAGTDLDALSPTLSDPAWPNAPYNPQPTGSSFNPPTNQPVVETVVVQFPDFSATAIVDVLPDGSFVVREVMREIVPIIPAPAPGGDGPTTDATGEPGPVAPSGWVLYGADIDRLGRPQVSALPTVAAPPPAVPRAAPAAPTALLTLPSASRPPAAGRLAREPVAAWLPPSPERREIVRAEAAPPIREAAPAVPAVMSPGSLADLRERVLYGAEEETALLAPLLAIPPSAQATVAPTIITAAALEAGSRREVEEETAPRRGRRLWARLVLLWSVAQGVYALTPRGRRRDVTADRSPQTR